MRFFGGVLLIMLTSCGGGNIPVAGPSGAGTAPAVVAPVKQQEPSGIWIGTMSSYRFQTTQSGQAAASPAFGIVLDPSSPDASSANSREYFFASGPAYSEFSYGILTVSENKVTSSTGLDYAGNPCNGNMVLMASKLSGTVTSSQALNFKLTGDFCSTVRDASFIYSPESVDLPTLQALTGSYRNAGGMTGVTAYSVDNTGKLSGIVEGCYVEALLTPQSGGRNLYALQFDPKATRTCTMSPFGIATGFAIYVSLPGRTKRSLILIYSNPDQRRVANAAERS